MDSTQVGSLAFLGGAIIALVVGVFGGIPVFKEFQGWIVFFLVLLGLAVGFLNIKDKEIDKFLLAAIALIAVKSANLTAANQVLPGLGVVLNNVVMHLAIFVAPAALIVSLQAIYKLAKNP